jgi:hypothetical protein
VKTGVSWTYRSLTIDGATTRALASAGMSYLASYCMTTRTSSPSGSIWVTSPMRTPRMRTSLFS